MHRTFWRVGLLGALILALPATLMQSSAGDRDREPVELTSAALQAIRGMFPSGSTVGVGRESEGGTTFFEVVVRDGERTVEVEVAADGAIGEVESTIDLNDAPRAVRESIRWSLRDAADLRVERREVRGTPRDGSFTPVDPPKVVFEFSYREGGVMKRIALDQNGARVTGGEDDEGEDGEGEDDEGEDDEGEDDEGGRDERD